METPLWKTQSKPFTLTKEMLESAEPNSIIYTGAGFIEHPWFNDAKTSLLSDGRSTTVNYVVYKIGTPLGWCIHHSLDSNFERASYLDGSSHLVVSYEQIARLGAKLHNKEEVLALINCDPESLTIHYEH